MLEVYIICSTLVRVFNYHFFVYIERFLVIDFLLITCSIFPWFTLEWIYKYFSIFIFKSVSLFTYIIFEAYII